MSQPLHAEYGALGRVFMFRGESGQSGTGVVLDYGEDQYLVTAAHITNEEQEEAVLLTSWDLENGWPQPHLLTRIDDPSDNWDIAVFALPERLVHADLTLPPRSVGLAISQDVLVLGYPYNLELRMKGGPQVLPMVKRGIVSGMQSDVDGPIHIYLDLIANPGFSGGPVLFRHQEDGVISVAGIVKGTYTQRAAPQEGWKDDTIAGISVATDIGYVGTVLGRP